MPNGNMTTQDNASPEIESGGNKRKRVFRVTILVFLIILAGWPTFVLLKSVVINGQLQTARELREQGNCAEAVPILNRIIQFDPKNAEAYYQRVICYGSTSTNIYEERYRNLVNAIYDLDAVIALRPGIGDYYVDKELIFRELGTLVSDSASKFTYYELATQNAEKAMELGVSPGYMYVYRHHARNLIASNHCEEGLQETLDLISQTNAQDPVMDYYNIYLTEAYLCLGELDSALESANKVVCEDTVATCRSGLLAEVYFHRGELEKAFELLDAMIKQTPEYGGWRYFMRAEIYYEQGQVDLALQDLATGDAYTWFGNGVYWYLKSKIAFEKGDEANGIVFLQYAESTLDTQYNPLRWKIQEELHSLGVEPLILVPDLPPGDSFEP